MQPPISCAAHGRPVSLTRGEPLICHEDDGGHCKSQQFTMETLSRAQAMALLILDRGWQVLNPGP